MPPVPESNLSAPRRGVRSNNKQPRCTTECRIKNQIHQQQNYTFLQVMMQDLYISFGFARWLTTFKLYWQNISHWLFQTPGGVCVISKKKSSVRWSAVHLQKQQQFRINWRYGLTDTDIWDRYSFAGKKSCFCVKISSNQWWYKT